MATLSLSDPRVVKAARVIWRIVKRAVGFFGSVAVMGGGFFLLALGGNEVRLTDGVILEVVKAKGQAISLIEWRDMFLVLFGIGVGVVMWGLYLLHQWFQPASRSAE
jgi:hypothetical protein